MRKPLPFGKYLLLDRIAVGGMAEVFVAKAFGVAGFERILAIKKILPTMVEDQEFIAMFVDEARIAVQLAHANIVSIHELGKHEESLYIAMEYVSGKDLRAILDRHKKKGGYLPVPLACYVGARICEALDYAHRKRGADGRPLSIIHRDVSPQNVLISFEGEVKICDFGIAKAADRSQKTQAGILKGKFGYMSPEQVRGLPIDRRSDVFAAGALMFEMLTGEKLFHGESDFSTLEKVRRAEVPSLSALNSAVPEALEKVVRKALAREPDDRYPWASDLQEDLVRFTLQADTVYTAKQLVGFIREHFSEDLAKEEERMQRWAAVPMPKAPPSAPLALHTPPGAAGLRVDADRGRTDEFAPFPDRGAALPAPMVSESVMREAARAEGALAAGIQSPAAMNRGLPSDPSQMSTEQFRILEDSDTLATPSHPVKAPRTGGQEAGAASPAAAGARGAVDLNGPVPDATTPETPLPSRAPTGTNVLSAEGLGGVEDQPTGPMQEVDDARPRVIKKAIATPLPHRKAAIEVDADEEETALRRRGRFGRVLLAVFASVASAALVVATVWFVFEALDEPETSILVISAQPSGAELTLDGHPAMLPFIDRKIGAGKHTVIVRASGHKEYAEEIFLEGGLTKTLSVELQSLDEAAAQPASPTAEEEAAEEEGDEEETGEGDAAAKEEPAERPARGGSRGASAARAPASTADRAPERNTERTGERTPESWRAAAPREAAEEGSGSMLVFSMPPGAAITVDGKPMGTTPSTLADLPVRNYRVAVNMFGYESQEVDVRLRAGQTVPVRLKLRSLGGGSGPSGGDGSPSSASPYEPPPPGPPSMPSAGIGKLICSSRPVAKVFIDGRDTGRWTPIPPTQPLEIPAGKHRIAFVTDSGRRHEQEITIKSGEMSRLVGVNIP